MKIPIITLAALLLTISIFAQQQTDKTTNTSQAVVKLISRSDTLQYSLGAFMGQWLVKNGFTISNPAMFNRGMNDVLQKNPLAVTDSTIVPIVSAYQLATQNQRSRQMEEQLFAALRGKQGVGVMPNGVHYIIIRPGSGIRPIGTDTVVINAIGVFPDGTVFEDTYKKKNAITTLTGSLIPGLNEAIQLMPHGSEWRIFIPSVLGYGTAGLPGLIPPNSALVFDIVLMEVRQGRR